MFWLKRYKLIWKSDVPYLSDPGCYQVVIQSSFFFFQAKQQSKLVKRDDSIENLSTVTGNSLQDITEVVNEDVPEKEDVAHKLEAMFPLHDDMKETEENLTWIMLCLNLLSSNKSTN